MNDTSTPDRYESLLNSFTRAVLAAAETVVPTLPEGFRMNVSADSDVVLEGPGGAWVGIQRTGDDAHRAWFGWRGSIHYRWGELFPTLAEAIAFYIEKGWPTVLDPAQEGIYTDQKGQD